MPHFRVLPPDEINVVIVPHCRVQSPGEINVVIVPHCRVQSPDEINVVIVPHCVQGVRIPSAILKIVFAIFYFIFVFNAV